MKVTALAIVPPPSADGSPRVTPELLASSLAKYSRSNNGIDEILAGIDWSNPEGAVDRIFKFVDYGHASIGGLTGGIPITIDGCSMLLAYKLFEIMQLVDGQESSTRYITMEVGSLLTPEEIGIPVEHAEDWNAVMAESFANYNAEYTRLDTIAKETPEIMRISPNLSPKVQERIRKNYALDRSRSFIPLATKTAAAYIATARVWAQTLRELESLGFKEAVVASELIREELSKFAPRLIRHSYSDEASRAHAKQFMAISRSAVQHTVPTANKPDEVFCQLDSSFPSFLPTNPFTDTDFSGKSNRYSVVSSNIRRHTVRFALNNISIAELRDLNRHRSGNRYTPFAPVGFYLPSEVPCESYQPFLERVARLTQKLSDTNLHWYGYLLGTQVAFEHVQGLDKYIYEVELRTGLGAHFRYAEHLEATCKELLSVAPELKPFIEIGTAEPE